MRFRNVPLDQIVLSKNVRSEADGELGDLMASIERFGLLQPVLVRPRGPGRYELIYGHRRYQAVKMLGDSTIACIIREDHSDNEIPFVQLVENIHRKQMHPSELVKVFDAMIEAHPGLTKRGIAALLKKSDAWVYDKYKAEQVFQSLLEAGLDEELAEGLTEAQLKRLGRIAKAKERARIAEQGAAEASINAAKSFRIQRRGQQHLLDMAGGFCVLVHSDRRLQVLCKSTAVRAELVGELQRIKKERTKASPGRAPQARPGSQGVRRRGRE